MAMLAGGLNFSVGIDVDGDGVLDAYITDDVKAFSIRAGYQGALDRVGNVGSMNLTLDNSSGVYSPLNNSSWLFGYLRPMIKVWVTVTGASMPVTWFVGYVRTLKQDTGARGRREAQWECMDILGLLQAYQLAMPLRSNWRTDQIIAGIVNAALNATVHSLTLTFSGAPADGATVTFSIVKPAGTVTTVYTFRTGTPAAANEVYAGASAAACAANFLAAFNRVEGDGSLYVTGVPPEALTASADSATVLRISQRIPGSTAAGADFSCVSSSGSVTVSSLNASGGSDLPAARNYESGLAVTTDVGFEERGINALSAIEKVVATEQGRFFQQRDGTLTFHNRAHEFLRLVAAPGLTFNGQPRLANEISLEDVYNIVQVRTQARQTQSVGIIAQAENIPKVPGRGTLVLTLPFLDPNTKKNANASSVVLPLVAGTDWIANEQPDGSGVDYATAVPGYVLFTYQVNAQSIKLTITNNATGDLHLTRLRVRGVVRSIYESQTIEKTDTTSITTYGLQRVAQMDLSYSEDLNYAESLASFVLSKYKDPAFRVTDVDVGILAGQFGALYAYQATIDDVVSISDAIGLSSAKYRITGYTVNMSKGTNTLAFNFQVQRLDDVTYWILDDSTYSVLDSTTRLGI